MKSPLISGLRSVALTVPHLARAEAFYTEVWRLVVATRSPRALYLRGAGADHHLLALHEAEGPPSVRQVTLRARTGGALTDVLGLTLGAGGIVEEPPGPSPDPAGGQRVLVRDTHGRRFEVVHGDERRTADDLPPDDRPQRLASLVLNSHDVRTTQTFLEVALGFVLADRTRIMAFMNCDSDHHSLAIGDTDNDALNHIAFMMPTLDAVMRGGGRMRDAGYPIEWGPGRHGPGDNAFNYFIDPFGIAIAYTADVAQIDHGYRVGKPSDWKWPPGRTDQWGITTAPSEQLKEAQRTVRFLEYL